jgi:STE24 endopeptidase
MTTPITVPYTQQADSASRRDHDTTVAVPEPSDLAISYHQSGNVLWAAGTTLSLVLPALILFTGLSARLRTWAYRLGRRWLPAVMLYAVLFGLMMALLTLPLAYYDGFVRQHAYGLSNQSLSAWLADWSKGVAVSAVGLAMVLWIPYLLLRRSPRRWWLYAGLCTIPIASLALVVSPLWIDPLFNEFRPLEDPRLEARILALAERAGIPESRVFQVNKSVDTKTVNAYVTGFGTSKRIVLWDTVLDKLEPAQVEFVMAHEMGHFVMRHVLVVIVVLTIVVTMSLYVVHQVSGKLITRFSRRFGFTQLSDVASLPLLIVVGGLVSLVATPAALAFSRHLEREADRFALELTGNGYAAATTFVRLQQENLAVPRPGLLYMLWRGSHPSLAERIDFANRYQGARSDQELW